jgi:cell wall assembly regulator SMI1
VARVKRKSASKSKTKAKAKKPTSTTKAKAKTKAKAQPAKSKSRSKANGASGRVRSIAELVHTYEAWCEAQGSPSMLDLEPPAAPQALAMLDKLAKEVGEIPPELRELFSLHDGGISFFEYSQMSIERMIERRKGLEELRKDGTFDTHEVFPSDAKIVRRVKWHEKWLPLFEDGGGNLYFMDLAPDKNGRHGQIGKWERAGGPGANLSLLLGEFLEKYVLLLEAGKLKFDDSFGIADAGNDTAIVGFV